MVINRVCEKKLPEQLSLHYFLLRSQYTSVWTRPLAPLKISWIRLCVLCNI